MIRRGEFARAAQALRAYLDEHADSATAHMLLGLVEYEQNRPADSLGEFTRAARLKSPRASELVIVGLDYVKLRDLANADKWMTVAVHKDPGSAGAWRYLGGIKYSENRFAGAIDAYRRCLQIVPRDVLSEDGIGRSMEGLGRDDEAEAAYRQAIAWQTGAAQKYAQPLLHLGILLTRKGQAAAGLEYLKHAEAIGPVDVELLQALGDAHMQLKQWSDAQAALERAIALAPRNSHLHWLLATVYRHEGKMEQAREQQHLFASLVGNHSNDKAQ